MTATLMMMVVIGATTEKQSPGPVDELNNAVNLVTILLLLPLLLPGSTSQTCKASATKLFHSNLYLREKIH
jgi:hypothetical protein